MSLLVLHWVGFNLVPNWKSGMKLMWWWLQTIFLTRYSCGRLTSIKLSPYQHRNIFGAIIVVIFRHTRHMAGGRGLFRGIWGSKRKFYYSNEKNSKQPPRNISGCAPGRRWLCGRQFSFKPHKMAQNYWIFPPLVREFWLRHYIGWNYTRT